MDQFSELTDVIVRILQKSQRALSLAALVDEMNQIPDGRALPASTIRLLLMKRSDLFTEISSGQWALASWSPTDQGVVRVGISGGQNPWKSTMGQVEAPKPLRRSLEELATEVLGHLVPASIDRPNLDTLTIFHISQSTYKPDSLPRATSDTNILVPPSLYEVTRNYAWRYPPMLETTFFLRASPAQHPCLRLRLVFGTATLLEYHEWRRFGDTQRVQRRNVATGEIRVPADFAAVDLAGSYYSIREDAQAKQFCRKATMPRFYEFEIQHTVKGDARYEYNIPAIDPADNVFVKAYDEKSRQTWTSPNVDLFKPVGLNSQLPSDDPRLALVVLRVGGASARVDVETEYLDDWGVYKVTIRFSNTSAGLSTHPQDHAILLNSIIFPHIYIRAEYASCILNPQQHVDRLQEIENGHQVLSPEDGFIASLTTQTNCVLTNSTAIAGTLVVTPFGVYDTMRVSPIQGPAFASLCVNIDTFLSGSTLSETAKRYIQGSAYRSSSVLAVMRAAQRAFGIQNLRSYQWKAIQNRLELLATGSPNVTTIIRAPTAAGKTLVFMVNAAIHYLLTGQRAVMTFPTRILNEDMFKRLTRFVYALRDEIAKVDSDLVERISGGIVIGTSDPSYQAIVNPVVGQAK